MDATGAASAKGGIPLQYPITPYTLNPGLYMYPTHPMAYVMPSPPVCVSPHAAMKGHDLYFSRQHDVLENPVIGNVRGSWSYHGQPLVEGTLDHRSYIMPPMVPAYQGTPYSHYTPQYIVSVQPYMSRRQATPRGKVLSLEDISNSETKDNNNCRDGKISMSVVNNSLYDNIQNGTNGSDCLKDKELGDKDLGDQDNIFQESINENKELTRSNEEENHSSANFSNTTSEEPSKTGCTRAETKMNNYKASKKKKGKQKNKVNDKVIENMDKERNVGFCLCEEKAVNDKMPACGASQSMEKRKEHLRSREERSCLVQLQGVITEVHCSMGKLRIQNGTEYYFSRDLCSLYGVSLAHLELWHVLIEGQQVKVTLNHINSELPSVTQVTVEEVDSDLDPEATTLNLQQWCSVNCVPEEATMRLIQQVRGLH